MPTDEISRCAWMGAVLAATVMSLPAFAQQVDTTKEAQSSTAPQPKTKQVKKPEEQKPELEEVVVTGTNIRTDVSELAAMPLTVLTAEDIAKQGPQEIAATLRENPLFSGGTLNGGSGGFFSGA